MRKGSSRPWITALLLCVLVPGDAGLRRHTEDEAFFPLDVVVRQTETVLDAADGKRALSAQHLNRLAGSLALHGRFVAADRALAASLRLQPSQGDALYLLASLRCMASRLGEARDALFKGYHSRAVSNLHEVAAVNSDTCARLPLLFPADAVSHERSYPLFPHYSHTERFYITQRDPADELRRCAPPVPPSPRAGVDSASDAARADAHVPAGLASLDDAQALLAPSAPMVRDGRWKEWGGETLIKQTSGDGALREGVALALLAQVDDHRWSVGSVSQTQSARACSCVCVFTNVHAVCSCARANRLPGVNMPTTFP